MYLCLIINKFMYTSLYIYVWLMRIYMCACVCVHIKYIYTCIHVRGLYKYVCVNKYTHRVYYICMLPAYVYIQGLCMCLTNVYIHV